MTSMLKGGGMENKKNNNKKSNKNRKGVEEIKREN